MGVQIINNHADYRLMSKRVCEEFLNFKESNLFLRGIVTQLGFKSTIVCCSFLLVLILEQERINKMINPIKYILFFIIFIIFNIFFIF